MKIAFCDWGKTQCTNEVLGLLEGVLEQGGYNTDNASYAHVKAGSDPKELKAFDIIIALGAEAVRKLCNTSRDLRDYAGSLTWNEDLEAWVLPTFHPNSIYQEKYNEFDDIYNHVLRAVDLSNGTLELPPKEGYKVEWEWIGHNGDGWDWRNGYEPVVWSGYNECTPEEADRAVEVFTAWLKELDA